MTKCARRFFAHAPSSCAGIEREFLAVAHGAHARRRDAERDQIVAGGERAALAERQVVFGRAAFVAVAFDRDLPRRVFLQHAGVLLQVRLAARLSSELSSSKNTGFSGESRLRSSSDFEPTASSGSGSAARAIGSSTGSGGRRRRRGRRRAGAAAAAAAARPAALSSRTRRSSHRTSGRADELLLARSSYRDRRLRLS